MCSQEECLVGTCCLSDGLQNKQHADLHQDYLLLSWYEEITCSTLASGVDRKWSHLEMSLTLVECVSWVFPQHVYCSTTALL